MSEGLEIIRADQELGMALLDLRENDADRELQMLRQMRSVNKLAKLVVLANGGSAIQLARTLDAGADGYLPQSLSREALVLSLKSVERGDKVFPTSLATQITRHQVDPTMDDAQDSSVRRLSGREREILLCLHWGEPNKTIARRYCCRPYARSASSGLQSISNPLDLSGARPGLRRHTARVRHNTRTAANALRHPVFRGLV